MSGSAALAAAKRRRSQPQVTNSKKPESRNPKLQNSVQHIAKQHSAQHSAQYSAQHSAQHIAKQHSAQQNAQHIAKQHSAQQNAQNIAKQQNAQHIAKQHLYSAQRHTSQNPNARPQQTQSESPMIMLNKHDKAIYDLHMNQDILNENMVELKKALEKAMDIRNILSDVIFKTSYMEDVKQRITKLEELENSMAKNKIMGTFQSNVTQTSYEDLPSVETLENKVMSDIGGMSLVRNNTSQDKETTEDQTTVDQTTVESETIVDQTTVEDETTTEDKED